MRLMALADIEPGGLADVDATIAGETEALVVHRGADGATVRAWLNVCPHAGRRLDWAPGKFLLSRDGLLVCAVHGAGFELGAGLCVSGPCRGQSLRSVAVTLRDDAVYLADG